MADHLVRRPAEDPQERLIDLDDDRELVLPYPANPGRQWRYVDALRQAFRGRCVGDDDAHVHPVPRAGVDVVHRRGRIGIDGEPDRRP